MTTRPSPPRALTVDVRLPEVDPRRAALEVAVREALAGQGRWQVTIEPDEELLAITLVAEDGSRWASREAADQEPEVIADLVRSACRRRSQRRSGFHGVHLQSSPDVATNGGRSRRSDR